MAFSFRDARILVTGGTGSFGHVIVERLLEQHPRQVRIFSRDEEKQWRMRNEFARAKNLDFMIGDVRDSTRVREAVKNIDIVFHAAALKQVPNCEAHPMEALKTNAIGAQNVIEAAFEAQVSKFIAVSTDKAVKPINAMGMTKAIQEKLVAAAAERSRSGGGPVFASVRYGNVVGSRGSVVPFFQSRIEKGLSLTVTDPRMTRFLLTLPQAIELVFHAAGRAKGGETFVRKMPGALVVDLAEVMWEELAPRSSSSKPPLEFVGIRPGEKIHEVLVTAEEMLRAREENEFFVVPPYASELLGPEWKPAISNPDHVQEYTSENTQRLDRSGIKKLLRLAGFLSSSPTSMAVTKG